MTLVPSEQPRLAPLPSLRMLHLASSRTGRLLPRRVGETLAAEPASRSLLRVAQAQGWVVERLSCDAGAAYLADARQVADQVALVLISREACQEPRSTAELRSRFPYALFVAEGACTEADLQLPETRSELLLRQLLVHAADLRRRGLRQHQLMRDVGRSRRQTLQLTEIGNALTTTRNVDELLKRILGEARRLANCDGASLYLLDRRKEDANELVFKLAENASVDFSFEEKRLPLTAASIAGFVALRGTELNLPDAYAIPDDAPYHFNDSFDRAMAYRTQSMLVLPMRDHHDQVVGVLQFINCIETDALTNEARVVPFGEELASLLRAVASQAAVSIQKSLLIEDMGELFESFVQASVKTIEQRDPTTSGHSFRVADKTVALLQALPQSDNSRFRELKFSAAHLREVRYAALLHDVGKIGVRESVLTKARKLPDDRLEVLRHRIEVQRERIRRRALEQQFHALHVLAHHGKANDDPAKIVAQTQAQVERDLSHLDQVWDWIERANEPWIETQPELACIKELAKVPYFEADGQASLLLSPSDIDALSVRRGSLTDSERLQIQDHVVHTRDFLSMLRWPPELAQVPTIAGAHHEKLDGTGYPQGLTSEEIPLASKVMTVCDIYDALTAMDRPYKRSISDEDALAILRKEAAANLIDSDIVDIFIESRVYLRPLTFSSNLR
ncbi:MAG: HD domain-containing phosphohydrolase [Pseudomonadota bacterium]